VALTSTLITGDNKYLSQTYTKHIIPIINIVIGNPLSQIHISFPPEALNLLHFHILEKMILQECKINQCFTFLITRMRSINSQAKSDFIWFCGIL